MHQSLTRTAHRPWELPHGKWRWRQSWCDLLFAHWPVPKELLRPFVPSQLEIEEFGSTAWIGVVPFRMEGVMRRPFPDLPWISAFPELNVRTYVEYEGKPGVWFFSLDATNPLAVWAARRFFYLPYFLSEISVCEQEGVFTYNSQRKKSDVDIRFSANYRPTSEVFEATPGSLEHWLTERYCLYAECPNGQLYRTEVHHHPWQLQRAEAEIPNNDLLRPFGVDLQGEPAELHFSRAIDVIVWAPEKVSQ